MLSSLIKRIQKTVSGGSAIKGDRLDELAAVNLSSVGETEKKPENPPTQMAAKKVEPEPQKPDVKAEEPKPEPPKPEPKPAAEPAPKVETKPKKEPKPEAVLAQSERELRAEFLISEAKKWVGVREKGGPNKGPEVEMFQKAVDGKASGEPWCCAFAWFCILEAEKKYQQRHGLKLSSWLYKIEHCLTLWNLSPPESKLKTPEPGVLVIWQHLSAAGQPTARGHIGIVTRVIDKTFIETVEGNTSSDSVVQDEGDGVYLLKRNFRQQIGTKRIVGFLLPWKD